MAQPNMGRRKLFATRLPSPVSAPFEAESSGLGLSHSQFLADLLADKYGLQRPSERFATKRSRNAPAVNGTLDLGLDVADGFDSVDDLRKVKVRIAQLAALQSADEPVSKTYTTRLPQDIAEKVEAEATATGLSYSHIIALLLAERYNSELPSERFAPKRTATDQEVLPLVRAS